MNECRIHRAAQHIDKTVIKRFEAMETSLVSDAQHRVGGATGLMPVAGLAHGQRIAGTALTVKTRPGDNLVVHRALQHIEPGHVLVIDAGGAIDRAIVGEIMVRQAKAVGAVGLVIDGAIRDKDGLDELGLPVFAVGVNHIGPYKSGPGAIHGPVQIGGSVVHDGDVVVADSDGIVFVPAQHAAEVIEITEQRGRNEVEMMAQADRGELDSSWLDQALNIEYVDREAGA